MISHAYPSLDPYPPLTKLIFFHPCAGNFDKQRGRRVILPSAAQPRSSAHGLREHAGLHSHEGVGFRVAIHFFPAAIPWGATKTNLCRWARRAAVVSRSGPVSAASRPCAHQLPNVHRKAIPSRNRLTPVPMCHTPSMCRLLQARRQVAHPQSPSVPRGDPRPGGRVNPVRAD